MNNEDAFLFSTFSEFLKCWRSGTKARVIIESLRGHAFVNFSAYLGHPDDVHFKTRPTKRKPSGGPRKKSARKIQRDNERAARFKERQKEGSMPVDNPGAAPPAPSPAVTSSPSAASAMTTSSLVFSFASPTPENLRQESRQEESMSMTLSDQKEQREPEASNEVEVSLVQEEELCVKDDEPAAVRDESSLPAPIDECSEFYIETLICDYIRSFDGQSVSSRNDVSDSDWLCAAIRAVGRMNGPLGTDPGRANEGINYLLNLLSEFEFKNEPGRALCEFQLNNILLSFKACEAGGEKKPAWKKQKKKKGKR